MEVQGADGSAALQSQVVDNHSTESKQEGKHMETEAGGDCPDKDSQGGENAEPTDSVLEFHLSCKAFKGQSQHQLHRWLAVETAELQLQQVKKQKSWGFAFVALNSPDDAPKIQASLAGRQFNGNEVVVSGPAEKKGGKKRTAATADHQLPGNGNKRHKTESASEADNKERVPTLKDLRDRIKFHKRAFDGDALEKSAPLMKWDYATQLLMKDTFVKTAVRSFTKHALKRCEKLGRDPPPWCLKEWSMARKAPNGCCCCLDSPIGAPPESLRGWRNKCEFTIGRNEAGEIDVGFILRILGNGEQVVGSVQEVPLVPEAMQHLCRFLAAHIGGSPFPIYDRRESARTGVWRMLLARQNPAGELLVMVQTTTLEGERRSEFVRCFVQRLLEEVKGIVSVYLQFNDEVTDAARPNAVTELVHGRPRLEMPMLGLGLEIGPLSFFNPNTTTCVSLMETTIEYLCPNRTNVILDIFSGVGTIGLCAARHCDRVIGVEIVEEAVEDARRNAERNGITNAEFHAGKAEDLIPKILGDMDETLEVAAVVDPSRAGLHPRLVEILRGRPQVVRIVYVSCNAESMAEDVAKLGTSTEPEADDFVPVRTVAVDSFPQTLHVEVIQLLERSSKVPDPRANTSAASVEQ